MFIFPDFYVYVPLSATNKIKSYSTYINTVRKITSYQKDNEMGFNINGAHAMVWVRPSFLSDTERPYNLQDYYKVVVHNCNELSVFLSFIYVTS